MSIIINKLKEKIGLVNTTEKLIYKDKIIDVFDINKSYEKLSQDNRFFKSELKYGKINLFISNNISDLDKLMCLFKMQSSLTKKAFEESTKHNNNLIISEVFNSLWIEGVRSSKKKIKQFLKKDNINKKEVKEKFFQNYFDAIDFVNKTESINEKTLYGLYIILSRDIDLGNEELDGIPYREGAVLIGNNKNYGIAHELIKESMDSIFDHINKEQNQQTEDFDLVIKSIIIHYLFELIHPYYDMNGRMGRLLTLWYSNINNVLPYFSNFSEAINLFKNDLYYDAFKKSKHKKFKYDATYFIQSVLFAIVGQRISFLLMDKIENQIKSKYKKAFSDLDRDIMLNIISKNDQWYFIQDFILGVEEINQSQVSQSLTKLVSFNILEETNTKPKQYKFNWSKENMNFIDGLISPFLKK